MNTDKTNKPAIKIAMADDHVLIRSGLAKMIDTFPGCSVIIEADNGKQLIDAIKTHGIPHILILDQNMPVMDGLATASWLYKHHREIKILMLSMYDSELIMIKLLKMGVRAFLKKDTTPSELREAIESVATTGFYHSKHISNLFVGMIRSSADPEPKMQDMMLDENEITFLRLCATDMTYKEIAVKMNLNHRMIEKSRDDLFNKFGVESRVGLVMEGIRQGLVYI